MSKLKLSRKHIQIINTIREKGKYRPTYSDQEPATKTLIKHGIIEWTEDMRGLVLTEAGKSIKTA
jgi:hypothetical protein